ncbi:O-antigen ligase [Sporomusa sp. KB1]|jgi:O-antigen ligase|uniref:O-antigen ligase family protein n=1 Tax=Sporomusa sp. KB1 TaxID=943346 RepID=UPI0011A8F445|nr:O-antigen ligase family protein [Sporomusa sp. KB1]TWH47682.1 O-antigen ligase-like membrane protein [Sporomusa sp. KB1]
MVSIVVVFALVLYTTFSFTPIAAIPILGRTLNMSPGDMFTILFVIGIFLKALIPVPNKIISQRPPAVNRFLYAYIFLAVVFLLATFLFFLTHNELVPYFGRSLFNFLLWCIGLVLFYYGSDSQFKIKELRLIAWLLMGSLVVGVLSNILLDTSIENFFKLITDTFKSDQIRLVGQVGDPNQLGALAAFFSTIGIMGVLYEQHYAAKLVYSILTAGTGLILVLTQSRESVLTLFVAILCISIFLLRSQQYGKAFVILLGLSLGSALVLINIPRIIETLTAVAVGDSKYALSDRWQVWRTALQTISMHPLGIGFETMYLISNNTIQQAHNAFLQSAVLAGYVGFFVFLGFIICLIKLLWEQKKLVSDNWMLEAYFVFLVGYLVTSLWSDHFISFYTFNAVFFGFLGFVACAR